MDAINATLAPPALAQVLGPTAPNGGSRRYYRPELDALRFFAFLCVMVHHGPNTGGVFTLFRAAGGFGLPMFFLLSAYLITELLLRESDERKRIHFKSFYIRRILRIWPLYFAAVAVATAFAHAFPSVFRLSPPRVLSYLFFIVNLVPGSLATPIGALWSISVEEQFYLIWPFVIGSFGRTSIKAASAVMVAGCFATLAFWHGEGWMLWYNTLVQFLFFATGAMLAIIFRDKQVKLSGLGRLFLFCEGFGIWLLTIVIAPVGTDNVAGLSKLQLCVGYAFADVGCVLIFFSFLGLNRVPRWSAYLGKISYGLYVFHLGVLQFCSGLAVQFYNGLKANTALSAFQMACAVDAAAFLITVGLAACSYQLWEKPFLTLKERFAFVRSRPA